MDCRHADADSFLDETLQNRLIVHSRPYGHFKIKSFFELARVKIGLGYPAQPLVNMGVTCVVSWAPPEGKTWSQASDLLQQRLELMGARKTGTWSVDCEAYQQGSGSKVLYVVRSSEQPLTCYGILENGTCITTESSFEQIMTKLGSYYQPRKGAHTEARGQRYVLGDNVVKVGAITVGQAAKGLVVEVSDCNVQ